MWGQKYQWISHKIDIRHPWQLKKPKSRVPFWSYQLYSTANFALTFFVYIISVLVSVSNEVGITCPPGWDRVYWSVEIWGDHGPALPSSDSPKWYEFRDITSWTRPINKSCYTYLALCLKRSNSLIFLMLIYALIT